jgi:hypothetical protein
MAHRFAANCACCSGIIFGSYRHIAALGAIAIPASLLQVRHSQGFPARRHSRIAAPIAAPSPFPAQRLI